MGSLPLNDFSSVSSNFVATGVSDEEGWVPGYMNTKIPCRRKCKNNQVLFLREEEDPNVSEFGTIFEGSHLERVQELSDKKKRKQKKKLDTVDWKIPHEIAKDKIPKDAHVYEMSEMVFGVPGGIEIPMETHSHEKKDEKTGVVTKREYKRANISEELANKFLNQFTKSYSAIFIYPWDQLPTYFDPIRNKNVGFNAWIIVKRSETKSKSEHAKKVQAEYYIDGMNSNDPFPSIGKHFDNLMAKMRKTDVPKSVKPFQVYRVWLHEVTKEGEDKYWSYPLDMIYTYEFRMTIQPLNGAGKRKREEEGVTADTKKRKETVSASEEKKEEPLGEEEGDNENDFEAAEK